MSVAVERLQQYQAQLSRLIAEYKKQQAIVGDAASGKDTPFLRQKIRRTRDRYGELDTKVQAGLREAATGGASTATFDDVRGQLRRLKQEYEAIDRDVRAKEKSNPMGAAADEPAAQGGAAAQYGAAGAGGQRQVKMHEFKQVDCSELHTEEQLQREKLTGVVEVEQNLNELHGMYQEFNAQMNEQQVGLDTMEKNIDDSTKHVEKGVGELREANKLQKSSRKKMCILLGIIGLIVAVAVVVLVVVLKK